MASKARRVIRVEGSLAYVPLTKGYEAVIDASDIPLLGKNIWHVREVFRADGSLRTAYAQRKTSHRRGEPQGTIWLHRTIIDAPRNVEVDHRDGNGLNNRRENLRLAGDGKNQLNKRPYSNNTSGIKGVTWHKGSQKWAAQIQLRGKNHHLGLFVEINAAAAAYAAASAELHGEFGRA